MNIEWNRLQSLLLNLTLFGLLLSASQYTAAQSRPFFFPEVETSEFVVTFPNKPSVKQIFMAGSEGLQAELVRDDLGGLIRAELVNLTDAQVKSLQNLDGAARDSLPKYRVQLALNYAESIGLRNATAEAITDTRGWNVTVRGYKEIEGITVTFKSTFFYGDRSVITLTMAAPSTLFPTRALTTFQESLVRRK